MTALFLTPEELEQLTGRKRTKEQTEALSAMGIHWLLNAAGALIVGRKHVEQVLCGEKGDMGIPRKRPNLKALNEPQGERRK